MNELGIALVAWSPLGAGFLAGANEILPEADFRNHNPRFTGDNLAANRSRFAPLEEVAGDLGISTTQLALAWLLNKDGAVYPIPGSRKAARVAENAAAAGITIPSDVMARIDALAPVGAAQGETLL